MSVTETVGNIMDSKIITGVVSAIFIALTVGLLGWTANTVYEVSRDVAVISARVENISDVENRLNIIVTSNALLEQRLERVESWNQNLSNRLASLEEDVRNAQN